MKIMFYKYARGGQVTLDFFSINLFCFIMKKYLNLLIKKTNKSVLIHIEFDVILNTETRFVLNLPLFYIPLDIILI